AGRPSGATALEDGSLQPALLLIDRELTDLAEKLLVLDHQIEPAHVGGCLADGLGDLVALQQEFDLAHRLLERWALARQPDEDGIEVVEDEEFAFQPVQP